MEAAALRISQPAQWVNRSREMGEGRAVERGQELSPGAEINRARARDAVGQVQGRWDCFYNFVGSHPVPSLCGCGWKRPKTAGQRSRKSEPGKFVGNCARRKRKMAKLTRIQIIGV